MNRHRTSLALLFLWAVLLAHAAQATTMGDFVGPYEWQLLQWAAITALLGGMIRTILSLESDKRVIRDIAREAAWDAFKSLTAGMIAFLLIQAMRSSGWNIPPEVRFAAVMAAGWQRIAAIDWMRGAVHGWLDARKAQVTQTPMNAPKDAP
jgi:hypothetical protein